MRLRINAVAWAAITVPESAMAYRTKRVINQLTTVQERIGLAILPVASVIPSRPASRVASRGKR